MSRDTVDEAVERAGKQLLILGTAALVVVAPGSWLLAAASLKPVERLRAQASVLEAQDAGGGLTVPRTRDEISRLARTFNDLLARLHATLEREQTFVADAGHELRTPLTVLRGELELARRPGRRKQELEAAIEVAAEETERLIRLTEDLLTLARDADGGSLRWVPVDLNELLDVACRRAQSGHIDKRVELTFVGGAVPTGEADPDRLRQALDNVLNNALRFAPPASDVRVSVRHEDGWIDVGIEDDGPGFPPDLLPYAFERFRQGDSARTRASQSGLTDNGTGLGLAIVRGIMRAHGGLVHAANHEGGGAVVTLRWPLTRHAAPTGARRRQ